MRRRRVREALDGAVDRELRAARRATRRGSTPSCCSPTRWASTAPRCTRDPERELTGAARPAVRGARASPRRPREPVAYIARAQGLPAARARASTRACSFRGPRPSCWSRWRSSLPRARASSTSAPAAARSRWRSSDERPDLRRHRQRRARRRARGRARQRATRWASTSPSSQADLLDGVGGALDAVVSNPPYVADAERALLAPEITRPSRRGRCSAGPTGSS